MAAELSRRGFVVVSRNQRVAGVELDIVARRRRHYVVVEVKTRRCVPAEESLSGEQQQRLLVACSRAQSAWRPRPKSVRLVLAAVSVPPAQAPSVRFFEVTADDGAELP